LLAFGGREQAAICGAILAARASSIPVLLDGFICSAAAAPLYALSPELLDHCLVGHKSAEPGHQKLLKALNKTPILDLDMRLGEGTGAALALSILRGAVACHNQMATFSSAGISNS
jgi:nicotinate-nucleotide--dimethylbenzimidazole phosphoribosyltransferase